MPIAVSMGDPAGIGPDITLMSWRERQRHGLPPFVLYGDPDVLAQRARALGLAVPVAVIASLAEAAAVFADALPVWPVPIGGPGTGGADAATVAAIEAATAAVAAGEALGAGDEPHRQAHARSGRSFPIPATPSSWPSWRCVTALPAGPGP